VGWDSFVFRAQCEKRAVIFNLKHPRADFRVAFLVLVLIPVSCSHLLSHNVVLAALVFLVSSTGGFFGGGGGGELVVRTRGGRWGCCEGMGFVGGWVGGLLEGGREEVIEERRRNNERERAMKIGGGGRWLRE